ncbi:MAG: ABC transporter ATP-binding protein [Lachnospiraceae bacterium]|nr:ABC transporter ATP-binding protein [Lachnospiraceae bacterium]
MLLVLCTASILAKVAQSILTTWLPKVVIEKISIGSSPAELIWAVLLFMTSLSILSGGEIFLTQYISIQRLQMNTFYQKRFAIKGLTTDYCNQEDERFRRLQTEGFRCCNNNNAALVSVYDMLMSLSVSLLGLTVFTGVLGVLNPLMILFLAGTTAGRYFLNRRIVKWTAENNGEKTAFQQRMDYLNRISGDIRSAKDIRLFSMTSWFSDLYAGYMQGLGGWYKRFASRVFGTAVGESGLTLLQESAAYLYLLYLVWNGRMTAADFVLYIGVITGFSAWLGNVMTQVSQLNRTSREINYYRSCLEYPERYRGEGGIAVPGGFPGTIRLKNVSYRYPGSEKDTLRNINLEIEPGEHLAVVGLNGAGKTTLVKLLCGLIDPAEGEVLYDGIDLREYNRKEYYRIFSAVFQQFSILPVTLAEIVAEAPGEKADRQRVRHCLERAGLWEKVSELPKGMDSEFGKTIHDEGVEFSGGEIQKLLLARALYRDAPILILDEPTAALDPIAESGLYENYHGMSQGKTSLFISHRLASTSFCHRILLMEEGVICEEGTHESLLAIKGKYRHLFETQAEYYREDKPLMPV